jgi:hypothetical protein
MSDNRKVFQILHGFCHWDATAVVQTVERSKEMFAPTLRFEDAPNYVREGWAFDDTKEGDERFIQPVAPEGWYYDLEKGVFVPIDGEDEAPEIVVEEVEHDTIESEDN